MNRTTKRRGNAGGCEPLERRRLFATYTVTTLADTPSAGQLTLRQAVADADAHAGADTVAFAAGLAGGTVALASGPIVFTGAAGPTAVVGPAVGTVTVDAHSNGRAFTVDAGAAVSMTAIGVTGGEQQAPDAAGDVQGGGIYSAGTLALTACSVQDCETYQHTGPGTAQGGGVYSSGPLTLVDCDVSYDSSNNVDGDETAATLGGGGEGGGIYCSGPLTLLRDTVGNDDVDAAGAPDTGVVTGNGGSAAGGGVFAGGAVTVVNCSIDGNRLTAGYGAGGRANGGGAFGGGLFAVGAVTVTGSTISLNESSAGGPSADGDVPTTGHAGGAQGGGIYAGGTVTLTRSTVDQDILAGGDGAAEAVHTAGGYLDIPAAGGGVYAAAGAVLSLDTVDADEVFGGSAAAGLPASAAGGGVYAVGPLSLSQTTVSEDGVTGGPTTTTTAVAGPAAGGGVACLSPAVLTASTVDHDTAIGGENDDGGTAADAHGGGVDATAFVTVTNCTIVDDAAQGGAATNDYGGGPATGGSAAGGGLYVAAGLTLADDTISADAAVVGTGTGGKTAPAAIAGGLDAAGGTVTLDNSVVSGDTAATKSAADIAGTLNAASASNLIGLGGNLKASNNGNRVGVTNPKLAALADNGGPTRTELPEAGSPLVDAGDAKLLPPGLTVDQRNLARVAGPSVDVGAVEVVPGGASTATLTGTVTAAGRGLPGVTVYLDLNDDGQLDAGDVSAATGIAGAYSFAHLPSGTYTVRQLVPAGYAPSSPTAGSYTVTPAVGQHLAVGPFVDATTAGTTGTVTGFVFDDGDGSGTRDAGEGGMAGVTVFLDLVGTGALVAGDPSAVTNAAGDFTFGDVAAGTVLVRVEPPVAGNYDQSDPAGGAGVPVTVSAGRTSAGVTFGEVPQGRF